MIPSNEVYGLERKQIAVYVKTSNIRKLFCNAAV